MSFPFRAAPAAVPDIFVFGADDFQRAVEVRKVGEGAYRGYVAVGDRQGLFRVRPLAESRAFPEVGLYRAVDELREYGNDEPLLPRVAEFTGGRFNPNPPRSSTAPERRSRRRCACGLRCWGWRSC